VPHHHLECAAQSVMLGPAQWQRLLAVTGENLHNALSTRQNKSICIFLCLPLLTHSHASIINVVGLKDITNTGGGIASAPSWMKAVS